MICGVGLEQTITQATQNGLTAIDIERISARGELTKLEEQGRRVRGNHHSISSDIPSTVELQPLMAGPIDPIQHQIHKGETMHQPKRMPTLRAALAHEEYRVVYI